MNTYFSKISLKARLLSLIGFLIFILILSGYFLQSMLNDNVVLLKQQSRMIENILITTEASQINAALRYQYNGFIERPSPLIHEKLLQTRQGLEEKIDILAESDTEALRIKENLRALDLLSGKATDPQTSLQAYSEQIYRTLNDNEVILKTIKDSQQLTLADTSITTLHKIEILQFIPLFYILGGIAVIGIAILIAMVDIFVPVGKITHAMISASRNTLNARQFVVDERREDEIGQVTRALNHLLNEVSSGIEKIREKENQLRETSQYLQAVTDNVVDGLVILEQDCTILSVNPSAAKIMGGQADQFPGTSFCGLFGDPVSGITNLGAQDVLMESPKELDIIRPDSTIVPVEVAVGKTDYGGKTLFIAAIRDISTRRQIESLVEKTQHMETVGRMTGGVAHDFNNMLTVLSGTLEILQMRITDSKLLDLIKAARSSIIHGRELTQRLLAFSRKQILRPETLNVNEFIPHTIKLMRSIIPESIAIHTSLGDDLWPTHIDPANLESALLNLAINARDALPSQQGHITIETANMQVDSHAVHMPPDVVPGDYVMIAISDNGQGIEKDIIHRVFDPFFTTKDVGKGTGLGLSMVYGFARQTGGFVTIYSEPDQGTTVKLYFPRSEGQAVPSSLVKTREIMQPPRGTESIMVVEDEPQVLNYVVTTLRELGYKVTKAADGPSALKQLERRKNLHMLITDIVMPGGMNGEELARQVKQQLPETRVLYISGYTKDALADNGYIKPGIELLSKPFTMQDLAQKVRAILDAPAGEPSADGTPPSGGASPGRVPTSTARPESGSRADTSSA